jgi:hypothetical protein
VRGEWVVGCGQLSTALIDESRIIDAKTSKAKVVGGLIRKESRRKEESL